jgi:ferredoxin-NADP reductase
VIYRDELDGVGAEVVQTLTRAQPPDWSGYGRRVDIDMLREVAYPPEQDPRVFVCGPTSFVEAVADGLVALGHRPGRIRTERFGGA